MSQLDKPKRAFLDSNVLAQIIAGSKKGRDVVRILRAGELELVTCSKCVYELYSLAKGTTKAQDPNKNHPLKKLISDEINSIAQRLFKKSPDIDALGNSYYWYNQCEQWQGLDYFESMESSIETLVVDADRGKARELLEKQKLFVIWKEKMVSVFSEIDALIENEGIRVCHYFQVFSSDWYKKYGFFYEQILAKDSLLPNEDFEIVLSALFLEAKVFVTEDDRGLIWRGGLSFGLDFPNITFCCPERLEEAISRDFELRYYRKEK